MALRTFQVLYVPDGLLASCIDAIRVLANPPEKHRAHITVRGPYPRRENRSQKVSRYVEGSEILIRGAGNFFDSGQNTIYLRCLSPGLKTVWDKPDYEYNPHITLYDGPSLEFAKKLWDIMSSRTLEISFIAGPLTPLVSSRRHQGGMALQADLNTRFLRDITGVDFDETGVETLSQNSRLHAIDKISAYLSSFNSPSESPTGGTFTQEPTYFQIKQVDPSSHLLNNIKVLAKKNSATLGFLPDGAFNDYARRGWILVAFTEDNVIGYVIYRISKLKAVLVHLCINESHRGRGIARHLFREVVNRTKELHGILANTRRDFPAHTMWPHLGFAAIGERAGRRMSGSVLTRWWYEHPHPTLFSNQATYLSAQSPIDVAIDLNIFYDLVTSSHREEADESRALQSDWLEDDIRLCVTPELFNEINRLASRTFRDEQRVLAHDFKRISGTVDVFEHSYSLLSSILGEVKSDRDTSDLRHLAHTAAAEVEFFVTRDGRILKYQSEIERATGVTPVRPADLVIEMDQVRNKASYQPARLYGSTLQINKLQRQQRQEFEDVFLNKALGETKSAFRRRLSAISPPNLDLGIKVILHDGYPVALFALETSRQNTLAVPCLRLRHGPLARTLARQIVTMAVDISIGKKLSITEFSDEWLEPYVEETLAEAGFAKAGTHWLKLNYHAIGNEQAVSDGLGQLLEQLRDLSLQLPGDVRLPIQTGRPLTATETVLMERTLRPLKLTNDTLDTLVIPVRPGWAQHLFDSGLAEQTLFGAQPDLVLHWENAYYRSSRSLGDISAPFRILWYVSQDDRYIGTGQIRAYSVGSSVEVLPASQAYERYKRLGVYEWQQVLSISDDDPDGPVMVIRFCDIEMFKTPINRHRFNALLRLSDNKRPSLRGPQRISESAFVRIYSEGQS